MLAPLIVLGRERVSRVGNSLYSVLGESNGSTDMQHGYWNAAKEPAEQEKATAFDVEQRIANLKSNIVVFDSLEKFINLLLIQGITSVNAGGNIVAIPGFTTVTPNATHNLTNIKTAIVGVRNALANNLKYLENLLKDINRSIDGDNRIRFGQYLAGNTVSSDLKTAGASILFVDAGISNIFTRDIRDNTIGIPKLYYGVSIYFRPIDKNTRRNTFTPKWKRKINNATGPDYQSIANWSVLQHLSLNVGLTLGAMKNSQFDNLFNSTSLLVGPAIRFARPFKISAGVAFLRRDTKNPLLSEKKVYPSAYVSLSVDIDFIQGIKEITSILFK